MMLPMRCIRRDGRINLAFDAISHAACSLREGATIARPWSSPQALSLSSPFFRDQRRVIHPAQAQGILFS